MILIFVNLIFNDIDIKLRQWLITVLVTVWGLKLALDIFSLKEQKKVSEEFKKENPDY